MVEGNDRSVGDLTTWLEFLPYQLETFCNLLALSEFVGADSRSVGDLTTMLELVTALLGTSNLVGVNAMSVGQVLLSLGLG